MLLIDRDLTLDMKTDGHDEWSVCGWSSEAEDEEKLSLTEQVKVDSRYRNNKCDVSTLLKS